MKPPPYYNCIAVPAKNRNIAPTYRKGAGGVHRGGAVCARERTLSPSPMSASLLTFLPKQESKAPGRELILLRKMTGGSVTRPYIRRFVKFRQIATPVTVFDMLCRGVHRARPCVFYCSWSFFSAFSASTTISG